MLALVVEYIPGRSLAAVIGEKPLDFAAVSRIIEQVAEGMGAVHARGLLHRDIKPPNIILGDDSAPKLVDFGLATGMASLALDQISGTPGYMAPEQARGESERIDVHTDIFGLGAVLYELLTGRPPFRGETLAETLAQARRGTIPPLRELNPRVPRPLERIAMKAVATDPDQRFRFGPTSSPRQCSAPDAQP